jgi:23S rRNA (pseudouridine1915-N3)-methyltransferase
MGRLEFIYVEPSSSNNIDVQKEKEAEGIIKKIQAQSCVVALEPKGKDVSSDEFAKSIEQWECLGYKSICFIIGGAHGLAKTILERADSAVSLSKMTMPHRLAKLFLVEQIYRAYSIIQKHPYHK